MKNMIKYTIGILITTLLLTGCEKTLTDFEFQKKPLKLVMNSLLNPDSIVKVHLTSSMPIYEKGSQIRTIENAQIQIFENDNYLADALYIGNGYYAAYGIYPKHGHTYRLEAKAEGFPTAWGSTVIPLQPTINEVKVDIQEINIEGFEGYVWTSKIYNYTLNIKVTDAQKDQFHSLALYKHYIRRYTDCTYTFHETTQEWEVDCTDYIDTIPSMSSYINFKSYDRKIKFHYNGYDLRLFNSTDDITSIRAYFSNEKLNIDEIVIPFNLYYIEYDSPFDIHLNTIDLNYYKYQYSLARHNEVDEGFLSQKVSIYSNIENGLGLLGSVTSTVLSINPNESSTDN